MSPIFCKLAHNASILAEGTVLRIYAPNNIGANDTATFDLDYAYSEIEALVNLNEGVVHILTAREVLLLESHEPHAENFLIKGRWPR